MEKQATAKLRRLRISPRKVRMVADLIRRKPVAQAVNILKFAPKKAVGPVAKLLNSAIANAKFQDMKESELFIQKITVDEGPKLKRWRARAMGRANTILKRTSHITIVLAQAKTQEPKPKAKPKPTVKPKIKPKPKKK